MYKVKTLDFVRIYSLSDGDSVAGHRLGRTCPNLPQHFDKKIEIRMDCADSLPIKGNHSELGQVFMNLCTNARDAMPDGGELSIEAGMEGDDALITISDTGLGMDEQTRRQCFDPFFTTKETDKGTGLGLSTTYGIVKDFGGEIHVFSGLNKGTTFKIYFPLAFSEQPAGKAIFHYCSLTSKLG